MIRLFQPPLAFLKARGQLVPHPVQLARRLRREAVVYQRLPKKKAPAKKAGAFKQA